MPVARNSKFFFLNHDETVRFRLISLGGYRNIRGRDVWELGEPFFKHISKTPFAPTGKKIQVCTTVECPLCNAGFKPTKLYKVHITINGTEHGIHDGTEKIFEMPPSAQDAVVGCILSMRERGVTEEDILNTEFSLTRLKPNQKPYFRCATTHDEEISEEIDEEIQFDDDDIKLLRKLSSAMEKQVASGKIHNTRGAMQNTLRKTHGWSDLKIDAAFDELLNENGFLKEEYYCEPEF